MPWNECSVMDEKLKFVARLMGVEADPVGGPGLVGVSGYF